MRSPFAWGNREMKDKKIIAKSDKSIFVFISVISFISLFVALNWLRNPSLRWIGIFFVSTLIFMFVLGVVMLIILPNNAIVQEEENFIIYQGIFKEIIPLSNILKAELAQLERGKKDKKNGGIVLTVKTKEGEERKLNLIVKDKGQVFERIKEILESVSICQNVEPIIIQDVE